MIENDMNQINILFIFLALLLSQQSCDSRSKLRDLNFLIGTWQIENKSTFEQWNLGSNYELIGKSYKMKDGVQIITETLFIKELNGSIIYEATVPNQNEGQSIPFTLNRTITDKASFENIEHDFPKKIQYKLIDKSTLFVNVEGEAGQGFSYQMIKKE